jgi:hypothetical protein
MSGGSVREGEVSLPILMQSWLPLLNHILWEIKLYAMSYLVKLYTIQYTIHHKKWYIFSTDIPGELSPNIIEQVPPI